MDLSWDSLKLDRRRVLLFSPCERVSVVARGYEPWDSTERELACRLSDGMGVVWWWCGDGGVSIPGSKPGSVREWGGMGVGMVLKLDQLLLYIYLICQNIGNPSLIGSFWLYPTCIGSFWLYPTCIQFPQSNAHRVGVASTNHTDKFWHTGSAEEYSSEEFDGWGVCFYARVWRSYLQAVLNECYFWFRQCDDVIIYVIPHYLYSDITLYGCDIRLEFWVIWSTTVLLHFDSVDFPSRKSGHFNDDAQIITPEMVTNVC